MTHHHQPQHRGDKTYPDPLAELGSMTVDHSISARSSDEHHTPERPHYVVTAHERQEHTGQVLMVLSPDAAGVLAQIITRFASTHPNPGIGSETYDATMWHHVALDLLRSKVLAGPIPEPVHANLYGGPRPTSLEVVR